MGNGNGLLEGVGEQYDTLLAEKGLNGLTDRELSVMTFLELRRIRLHQGQPFWSVWKPTDITKALLAVLTALGVVTAAGVTAALNVLGS